MKFKTLLRLTAVALAVFCLLSVPVGATSAYQSYVYDNNGIPSIAPDAFRFESSIDVGEIKDSKGKAIGDLKLSGSDGTPGNIFVAHDDKVFIADSGNGRIIILNSDYSLYKIISSFQNTITLADGTKKTFTDTFRFPTYVFVDTNTDEIYICDQNGAKKDNVNANLADEITEGTSGRVIQLDKNGNFVRQIAGINSEVLPDGFIFQPTKMVVDNAGRIFVLSRQCIQGILELSEAGEFVQCLGAAKVTYSAAELIKRMFMTKAQLEAADKNVSTEYSGITVDEDNFLYVTNSTFEKKTANQKEMLAKLNAKGKNVLRKISDSAKPYGDSDAPWKGTYSGPSQLVDVMALDNGIYAVLDALRGRVFFYNSDGVNLFEFGTREDPGDTTHVTYLDDMLSGAISMAWHNNSCIVLDAGTGYIKTFVMTDYAKLIMQANDYHMHDEYSKEEECWKEVLKVNLNSAAAKQNIAKVYYRLGDYDTAMEYFKDIQDQDNYSLAYKYKRQQIIEQYFGWGLLGIILLVAIIIVIKKLWKKFVPPAKENSYWGHLKYAGTILSRPLNGSWFLVRENHASVASATTLLIATSIMSLLQARFTGFIFNAQAQYVNIILEMLKIIAPVMLFCVCNWCVTSLLNGEGNFRAIYIGTCYSLTPILILYPFAILFSNIMLKEEGDFFSIFVTLGMVLALLLIFATNMRIHDFGPGFAVLELFITVIVMILVVFLAVLFFALVQQMYDFISRLLQELATRT